MHGSGVSQRFGQNLFTEFGLPLCESLFSGILLLPFKWLWLPWSQSCGFLSQKDFPVFYQITQPSAIPTSACPQAKSCDLTSYIPFSQISTHSHNLLLFTLQYLMTQRPGCVCVWFCPEFITVFCGRIRISRTLLGLTPVMKIHYNKIKLIQENRKIIWKTLSSLLNRQCRMNHCPHNDGDMHFPTYVYVYINIIFILKKYLRNIFKYFLNLLQ